MVLHRITYMLDKQIHVHQFDAGEIDPIIVASYAPLFKSGNRFDSVAPHFRSEQSSDVRVKWIGFEVGQAAFSVSFQEEIFLSGVVVSGTCPESDADILESCTASLLANADAGLAKHDERPLLVVFTVPSVSPDVYSEWQGIELFLATAFLQRSGNW